MQEDDKLNNIVSVEIENEMKKCYIDYAMSVIVARALPDVRDGLKPVHRRILYAMNELNLDPDKAYKKCARIVGDTMGKYHPHGDAAIYDSLVRLAQDFSMRYILVDGHGNFGSIDGYEAAASRYTEARLSPISLEMLSDIEKDTVDFIPNYTEEFMEPTVLPSRFPNLLVNGSAGIAVGMATNIPPHNLSEVIDGIIKIIDNHIIENRQTSIDELLQIIKGPDFPTGATILGKSGIINAYRTGKGKLTLRSKTEIESIGNGKERILVTEIPYQVNKSKMIEKIAELVKDKKVEGISDIIDESDRNGIKIIIETKKDANANVVLNKLFKYSQLQESYSINMLALVNNEPHTLSLKQALEYYLEYQEEVVTRRTKFELNKALKREHIVKGLIKALDSIDEIIEIIRLSKSANEAKESLIDKFEFSEEQVNAIIEMRLRSLTSLEREKLDKEFNDLTNFIKQMQDILSDKNKLYSVIRTELNQIKQKYGDERRTNIVNDTGDIEIEDLIEDEMSVVTMTNLDYIKRLPLTTYKSQNRGGKGIMGMQTRNEDIVKDLFLSGNLSYILFFTNKGKVYRIKTYKIPEVGRTAKGTPIINLIDIDNDEKITAVIPIDSYEDDSYLIMVTKKGIIKKINCNLFANIQKKGTRAITLLDGDDLVSVKRTSKNKDIFIVTKLGKSIRFNENTIRDIKRGGIGVKAMKLDADDEIVGVEIIEEGCKILIASANGFGKCTLESEYKSQSRGGKGLKACKVNERTGNIVGVNTVTENEELMIMTSKGSVIRIRINDISTYSRVSQGVKLVNVQDDINVVSIAKIPADYIQSDDIEQEDKDNA